MTVTMGRNLKYLFLTHFTFIGLLVIYALLFQEKPATEVLVPPYIVISILATYSALFLPVTASSLFILVLLSDKKPLRGKSFKSGEGVVYSILASSIPSAIIYFLLVFFMEPGLIAKKEWLEELSDAGVFYIREAERNLNEGNLEESLSFADLYLYIDPDNRRALEIKNDIKIALPGVRYPDEMSDDENRAFTGDILTGEKLLERAEYYFSEGDYSSAAYYSQMAGRFRSSRERSVKLLARASGKLSVFSPDWSMEKELYDGKTDIERLTASGDYYSAYYLYHRLSGKFASDSELAALGEKLFSHLESVSFFHEEIKKLYFAPGKTGIAFVNSSSDRGRQLLFADKIVFADGSLYFFDIDLIDISSSGEITRHMRSMYGKAIDGDLNMQCIGKESRLLFLPEILKGSENDRTVSVKLSVPEEAILYTGREDSRLRKVKTSFLAGNLELLTESGAGRFAPVKELYLRFIRFFNFIFTQLAVAAAGISFLGRRQNKSYLSLLLLPAVAATVYILEHSIIYLKSGMVAVFIEQTGMLKAAVIYTAITLAETGGMLAYTVKKASELLHEHF